MIEKQDSASVTHLVTLGLVPKSAGEQQDFAALEIPERDWCREE